MVGGIAFKEHRNCFPEQGPNTGPQSTRPVSDPAALGTIPAAKTLRCNDKLHPKVLLAEISSRPVSNSHTEENGLFSVQQAGF